MFTFDGSRGRSSCPPSPRRSQGLPPFAKNLPRIEKATRAVAVLPPGQLRNVGAWSPPPVAAAGRSSTCTRLCVLRPRFERRQLRHLYPHGGLATTASCRVRCPISDMIKKGVFHRFATASRGQQVQHLDMIKRGTRRARSRADSPASRCRRVGRFLGVRSGFDADFPLFNLCSTGAARFKYFQHAEVPRVASCAASRAAVTLPP